MSNRPHFAFFQNKECEYFPCHEGVPEEDFNCLFCYCPLYALGKKCGGACTYNEWGYKDCSHCTYPHQPDNYLGVISRYEDVMEIVRQQDQAEV